MALVRKLPLSESVLTKIQEHVKLHCEAFASDTVYLDKFSRIPGGQILAESQNWPMREAFEYFQHLGVGRLTGASFKVLDREYFGIDVKRVIVSVSFTIDERIRSELPVMLDMYAQIYDAENRLRYFLNQKLQQKYGPDFFPHLPPHVQGRIALEKSRASCYVVDLRKGDLEFTHVSDLKRIIIANEEFVVDRLIRSILLQKLDHLNSIRHLAAHNNLIMPAEISRIRDNCEFVRLITGTGMLGISESPPHPAESNAVTTPARPYAQEHLVTAREGETELV